MTRPMSEVLAIVLARGEMSSSILIGLEDSLKYGDITREEFMCANRMIGVWLHNNPSVLKKNFSGKKVIFNEFIKKSQGK